MQRSKFSFKKSIELSLSVVIAVALLLNISSCKGKKADFGPSCIILENTTINNAWVTPGYTSPGSSNIIDYLKFITAYNPITGDFKVSVQAFKGDNSKIGGLVKLNTGVGCPVTLPPVSVGENIIDLSTLDILETNGTLKNFDYIKLTPKVYVYEHENYLTFAIEVVTGGVGAERPSPLPCPPCDYCKPPCVDAISKDITDSIPNSKDSMGTKAK